MKVWAWLQPGNRIWKVVSDPENGTIRVYDHNDKIIYERSGLPRDVISVIEANFLTMVAANLSEESEEKDYSKEEASSVGYDNPMYV